MANQLFNKCAYHTAHQQEKERIRGHVYATIKRICDMKAEHKVVPEVATERELSEFFEDKHWKMLQSWVEQGIATKTRGVCYDLYTINYHEYERYEQRLRNI